MSGTSRPVWLFRFLQKLKYQCLYWSSTNYNRKLCPGFDPDMCRIRKEWVLESRFVYFRFRVSWDFLKNWVPWGPQFLKNWVPFGSLNGTFKGPMSIWEHWVTCLFVAAQVGKNLTPHLKSPPACDRQRSPLFKAYGSAVGLMDLWLFYTRRSHY